MNRDHHLIDSGYISEPKNQVTKEHETSKTSHFL